MATSCGNSWLARWGTCTERPATFNCPCRDILKDDRFVGTAPVPPWSEKRGGCTVLSGYRWALYSCLPCRACCTVTGPWSWARGGGGMAMEPDTCPWKCCETADVATSCGLESGGPNGIIGKLADPDGVGWELEDDAIPLLIGAFKLYFSNTRGFFLLFKDWDGSAFWIFCDDRKRVEWGKN